MNRKFIELQVEFESRCFLRCRHCSSADLKMIEKIGYTKKQVQEFCRLFKEPLFVNLSGGEPLYNSKLKDFISSLKRSNSNSHIGIFSSGLVNKFDQCSGISVGEAILQKKAGLESCYISMYHDQAEKHDFMTRRSGSFACAKQTICSYLKAGIIVKVHLVLTQLNIDCIDRVINSFGEVGVDEIRILKLIKHGNAKEHWDYIGIPGIQQDTIIKEIIKKKDNYKAKVTISGFPDQTPCRSYNEAYKCQAGTNLYYITYTGDVYPCALTKNRIEYRIGHLSDLAGLREYLENNMFDYREVCIDKLQ